MFLISRGLRPLLGAAASVAVLTLAGCNALYGGSAKATSVFTGTVPSVYALAADGNVARATLDHSKEYVVLGASLEEYPLPAVWADSSLYPTSTAPTVTAGSTNYFKYLQIDLGTTAKVFTGTVSGSTVVYTATDGTVLDATLTTANQKWYFEAMASGNFYVLASATAITADNALVDFTKNASSTTVGTKVNRWKQSVVDPAWKTGADEATAFVVNKVIYGTKNLPLTVANDTWKVGVTATGVTKDWALDDYYATLVDASVATDGTSTGTDATAGASE